MHRRRASGGECKKIPQPRSNNSGAEPTIKERVMFMSARLVLVTLVCVGLVECSGGRNSTADTVEAAAAQRSLPADALLGIRPEVYAALLSGMGYHGVRGSEMLVKDEWIPIPAISDSAVAEWLRQFDAMPVQLREAVRRPAVFKPRPINRSLFPAETRFISKAALDAVFMQGLLESWTAFRRQYKSEGWVCTRTCWRHPMVWMLWSTPKRTAAVFAAKGSTSGCIERGRQRSGQ